MLAGPGASPWATACSTGSIKAATELLHRVKGLDLKQLRSKKRTVGIQSEILKCLEQIPLDTFGFGFFLLFGLVFVFVLFCLTVTFGLTACCGEKTSVRCGLQPRHSFFWCLMFHGGSKAMVNTLIDAGAVPTLEWVGFNQWNSSKN